MSSGVSVSTSVRALGSYTCPLTDFVCGRANYATKNLERPRGFFRFSIQDDWIAKNPARGEDPKGPRQTHPPVHGRGDAGAFSRRAIAYPRNRERLRAFLLVMRYSALQIWMLTAYAKNLANTIPAHVLKKTKGEDRWLSVHEIERGSLLAGHRVSCRGCGSPLRHACWRADSGNCERLVRVCERHHVGSRTGRRYAHIPTGRQRRAYIKFEDFLHQRRRCLLLA